MNLSNFSLNGNPRHIVFDLDPPPGKGNINGSKIHLKMANQKFQISNPIPYLCALK
jgi:hypothetical protein